MLLINLILCALLPLLALAKSHKVVVGAGGALKFAPRVLHAKKGDKVDFHFVPGADHGVAEGEYFHPCQPKKGGFWSGFQNKKGTVFTIKVKDDKPTWIYCPQSGHCQSGMAMVINPGKNQKVGTYISKAARTQSSGHQAHTGGGKLTHHHG